MDLWGVRGWEGFLAPPPHEAGDEGEEDEENQEGEADDQDQEGRRLRHHGPASWRNRVTR